MGSSAERERFNKLTACICPEYELLTPCDLKYRMNRVKIQLLENDVDLDYPCSAGPSTVCWLLDALCPCNAILYKGGLGLCEEELGCLTCKTHTVPKSKELLGNEGAILEAAYLLYRLFEQHRCLQRAIEANRDILEAYVSVKGRCAIGLASNFTLTVLQNICALQQAVRFVLKPNMSKRSAEMFQRYENSRELFRRVERSDEASSWGTCNLILSAAEFIGCYFFVVAEIVKGTLQCEQTSTTTAQLDDLNGVCVLKIVSFLRLSDVRS
ncbi:hypothetical protein IscW_ISCW012841 [Ixodes scapularis]|uniref:Uncharacterized protein n=1 Tax=Ixodes scapularis TaxID=6945 RepID=B7QFV6_IXOSC|nr:hypothetical protein IscW_ISCW012841 [Ixodes scapularis]|eukprot:XP_002400984.1 hypothetical protein IscW_ISCW012841 [Ixodes scapularis]